MRRLWVLIVLAFVVSAAFPTVAQFLTQEVPLNGARISIPGDWTVAPDTAFGGQVLSGNALILTVYDPVVVGQLVDVEAGADAAEVVAEVAAAIGLDVSAGDIAAYDGTLRPSALVSYETPVRGALIATRMRADRFLVVNAQADGQVVEKSLDIVDRIINSYITDPTMSPGMVVESAAEAEPEAVPVVNSEPCFVAQADGATLRVGPGLNRSSIAFLTTTTPVTVTGRFVADDSGVWYQLDRAQAAPQSAANELWVAAEQVETTGGCDTIGEVAAPPIIRASNPPAAPAALPPAEAAPEANTTALTTGEAAPPASPQQPQAEQPASGGLILPRAGTWTLTFDGTTNMSCQGTGNLAVPTAEILDDLSFSGYLSARQDGSVVDIDGQPFVFAPPDLYVGSFTYDDGSNMQLYLVLSSPTFITGRSTVNLTIDNIPCSATTGISIARN